MQLIPWAVLELSFQGNDLLLVHFTLKLPCTGLHPLYLVPGWGKTKTKQTHTNKTTMRANVMHSASYRGPCCTNTTCTCPWLHVYSWQFWDTSSQPSLQKTSVAGLLPCVVYWSSSLWVTGASLQALTRHKSDAFLTQISNCGWAEAGSKFSHRTDCCLCRRMERECCSLGSLTLHLIAT